MIKRLLLLLPLCIILCSANGLKKAVNRANKKYFAMAPYDVIIVPGYPYFEKPDFDLLTCRMNWAKELYDRGIAKNIIFSGGAIHTAYTEGKVMRIISDSLHIPQNHVFVEDKAPHSFQNLTYSVKLAKQLGFKSIAVATDPWQFSYMRLFKGAAPKVGFLTFEPDSSVAKKYFQALPKYDPRDAFVKDFVPAE
jgi:uncharacterized SAM-binding protein YcdF (DUF218 family)